MTDIRLCYYIISRSQNTRWYSISRGCGISTYRDTQCCSYYRIGMSILRVMGEECILRESSGACINSTRRVPKTMICVMLRYDKSIVEDCELYPIFWMLWRCVSFVLTAIMIMYIEWVIGLFARLGSNDHFLLVCILPHFACIMMMRMRYR